MIIDAPREQWLIDLRAELAAAYPAKFLEEKDYAIRSWISSYAIGELAQFQFAAGRELEALREEIREMYEDDQDYYDEEDDD
jgi:hypothetical protein